MPISRWRNLFQNPTTTLSCWLQMDINRTCRPKVCKPASPQSPARPPAKHFIFGTVFLKFLNYQDFAFFWKIWLMKLQFTLNLNSFLKYTSEWNGDVFQLICSDVWFRVLVNVGAFSRGHREGGRLGSAKKSKTPFF